MSDTIRRRSLPDSLRWLADKLLTEDLSAAERAGVAVTLQMLADEMDPDPADCTCGAPQGRGLDDTEIRNGWQHSRDCPLG
jgi:hypothetical protein